MATLEALIGGGRLDGELAGVAEALRAATVQVRSGRGSGGAGVVWSADGTIVTNAHVLRGDGARVVLADGRELRARVVAKDEGRDLARLEVDAAGLSAAEVGDAGVLRPGEVVMALGNPLGWVGALAFGVVHEVPRSPRTGDPRWIRADIRLAPGNSGGPLANARGRVVGINTMIVGGLGVAIPVSTVARFLADGGRTPTLGVTLRPVGVREGSTLRAGLLVLGVAPGSPAEAGGILPGDVLLSLDGAALDGPGDLAATLAESSAGASVRVGLARGGRVMEREVAPRAGWEEARAA